MIEKDEDFKITFHCLKEAYISKLECKIFTNIEKYCKKNIQTSLTNKEQIYESDNIKMCQMIHNVLERKVIIDSRNELSFIVLVLSTKFNL